MKKLIAGTIGVISLGAFTMAAPVMAAELLDVKPLLTGSSVAIEVTADIPMTYTYYKVPGQARAVVDIADADPEKVEPLIVVNKGAVASISVDKAAISDLTVSRLVFNLVSESDINVVPSPDRKKLTVSFGSGSVITAPVAPAAVPEPVAAPEPKKEAVVAVQAPAPVKPEDDPLGLDEPQAAPAVAPKLAKDAANPLSKEEEDPLGLDEPKAVQPSSVRSGKLQPVVPASPDAAIADAVVKGIVVGSSYIDIQTNGNVDKIKHMKLVKPDRLAIDIPGTSTIKVKSIAVNKFGISKMRIGKTPGVVRIVLDAQKAPFPAYSVDSSDSRVRINFN